jgi:hypothetical protein
MQAGLATTYGRFTETYGPDLSGLDVFNLDLLGLYVCEALENITPARQDKAVPHYGQRKLVGRRVVEPKLT